MSTRRTLPTPDPSSRGSVSITYPPSISLLPTTTTNYYCKNPFSYPPSHKISYPCPPNPSYNTDSTDAESLFPHLSPTITSHGVHMPHPPNHFHQKRSALRPAIRIAPITTPHAAPYPTNDYHPTSSPLASSLRPVLHTTHHFLKSLPSTFPITSHHYSHAPSSHPLLSYALHQHTELPPLDYSSPGTVSTPQTFHCRLNSHPPLHSTPHPTSAPS